MIQYHSYRLLVILPLLSRQPISSLRNLKVAQKFPQPTQNLVNSQPTATNMNVFSTHLGVNTKKKLKIKNKILKIEDSQQLGLK